MSECVDYSRYSPANRSTRSRISFEAFLDAVNAERIDEMVEELADRAQFVVSHRSAMLDRSQRAIGVTMQQDNVSTVTGIDLSSEEASADD